MHKDIKIRTVDPHLKRELNRFKQQEEPTQDHELNAESLKKLTGFRDLGKVNYFALRD